MTGRHTSRDELETRIVVQAALLLLAVLAFVVLFAIRGRDAADHRHPTTHQSSALADTPDFETP